jgi:hypothetical protein
MITITTPELTTLEKMHERTKVRARRRHVAPYRCGDELHGNPDHVYECVAKPLRFSDDSCLQREPSYGCWYYGARFYIAPCSVTGGERCA